MQCMGFEVFVMKYFTKELWILQNASDNLRRIDAERQWIENSKKYNEYFTTICLKLDPDFLKIYSENQRFHDFFIKKISFVQLRNKNSIEIILNGGSHTFVVKCKNIDKVKLSIENFDVCVCSKLSWGYSEIYIQPDGKTYLCVLCDFENEFEILCDKIEIREKFR